MSLLVEYLLYSVTQLSNCFKSSNLHLIACSLMGEISESETYLELRAKIHDIVCNPFYHEIDAAQAHFKFFTTLVITATERQLTKQC